MKQEIDKIHASITRGKNLLVPVVLLSRIGIDSWQDGLVARSCDGRERGGRESGREGVRVHLYLDI